MRIPPTGVARTLSAILLSLATSCSSAGSTRDSVILPPGIAPFKNFTAAVNAGIYPGNGRACCFLGPSAHLNLDKPAGGLHARFTFYVPKVPPFDKGLSVTVSAAGKRATGSLVGASNQLVISLDLPETARDQTTLPVTVTPSKSFVPREIGMNNDPRRLSVVLLKVEYP